MDIKNVRFTRGILATALIIGLAVPTVALAMPGKDKGAGHVKAATMSQTASRTDGNHGRNKGQGQPMANMRKRIANVLRARGHHFGAVASNLDKRIARLNAITATIEAAGGDVTAGRNALVKAADALVAARLLEAQAIASFDAIPGATDRKAAFKSARQDARLATAKLKEVRADLRIAAHALQVALQSLASTTASGTADAPK